MKKFIEEFKEFAFKGNMIDMAIGVLIAGAFTTLVNAFMTNIVNPLIGLIPGVDSLDDSLKIVIPTASADSPQVAIKFGAFIGAILTFLIFALIVFLVLKAINHARKLQDNLKAKLNPKEEEESAPTTKICPRCRSEIDIEATRCPFCTSELE